MNAAHWIRERVHSLLHTPREELGSWARVIRFQINLWRFCIGRLRKNNAMAMSAALSFRTIFAMVPVLILAFLMLKPLGVVEDSRPFLEEILTRSGLDEIYVHTEPPEPPASQPATTESQPTTLPADAPPLLDVAVDPNGRVLAVDGVGAVVYAAGPSEAVMAPITGSLKQYARFPSRITTDGRGRIYLTDRNGCRIVILGQDGSFLSSVSTRGFKDGLLQYPAQISISGGTLFVADTRNHRFQVFTLSE